MPGRVSLHDLLLAKRLVSEDHLLRAVEHQLVFGGKLGTNLVELGYVRLDDLGHLLAVQLGVQHADARALGDIPPGTLRRLTPKFCVENQALPLRFQGAVLHLALSDPRPERVQAIASQLGQRVVPYVVPELRMLFFLERYFRFERPGRFLRLPDGTESPFQRRHYLSPTIDLPVSSLLWPEEEGAYLVSGGTAAEGEIMVFSPVMDPVEGRTTLAPGLGHEPADEGDELIYLDELPGHRSATAGASVVVDPAALPEPPPSVQRLIERLSQARGGDEIAQLLVEPSLAHATLRLLFLVRGGLAVGYRAGGSLARPERVAELVVPIEKSWLLRRVMDTKDAALVDPSADPLQAMVAEFLGAPPPAEVCAVPVLLGGRAIHLLCLHAPRGARFPETALLDLRQLSGQASSAYLRLKASLAASRSLEHT